MHNWANCWLCLLLCIVIFGGTYPSIHTSALWRVDIAWVLPIHGCKDVSPGTYPGVDVLYYTTVLLQLKIHKIIFCRIKFLLVYLKDWWLVPISLSRNTKSSDLHCLKIVWYCYFVFCNYKSAADIFKVTWPNVKVYLLFPFFLYKHKEFKCLRKLW